MPAVPSLLFKRDFSIIVGGKPVALQAINPVTGVTSPMPRTVFKVERNTNRDPNKAEVTVYNLNSSNRKILQTGADIAEATPFYEWPLVIEAGYTLNRPQIFSGDIVRASSKNEGVDWLTTIEAEDGGKKYKSARWSMSYGPGTTLTQLLIDCTAALGVGLGNSAAQFASFAQSKRPADRRKVVFPRGVTVSGQVSRILDKYITTAGYQWSIQDGALQVLGPDSVLIGQAVVLNQFSGLIGSIETGEKGVITGTSLMNGLITPGRQLIIASKNTNGIFKTTKVTHSGDTWGSEWYSEFEGKPLA
jgi:hypothetical protein